VRRLQRVKWRGKRAGQSSTLRLQYTSVHCLTAGTTSLLRGVSVSLTKAMAFEWGRFGIRVNCVVPGPTDTSNDMMWPGLRDEDIPVARSEVAKTVPLGRLGCAEDVARASVWLCSQDAAARATSVRRNFTAPPDSRSARSASRPTFSSTSALTTSLRRIQRGAELSRDQCRAHLR
jgi:hypothetical protein